MSDYTAEVESRLRERLHTIPAGVTECCQPCADIRAALGEIRRLEQIEDAHVGCVAGNWNERALRAEAKLAEAQASSIDWRHKAAQLQDELDNWRQLVTDEVGENLKLFEAAGIVPEIEAGEKCSSALVLREFLRLKAEKAVLVAEVERLAALVQRYHPAHLGLPHVVRERDEAREENARLRVDADHEQGLRWLAQMSASEAYAKRDCLLADLSVMKARAERAEAALAAEEEKREQAEGQCEAVSMDCIHLQAKLAEAQRSIEALDATFQRLFPDWQTVVPPAGKPLRVFLLERQAAKLADALDASARAHERSVLCHGDLGKAMGRADRAEAEVARLRDQVENLLHRMTSEEAAAEIERLRADRDSLRQDRDAFSESLTRTQAHLAIAVAGEGFYEQFKAAEAENARLRAALEPIATIPCRLNDEDMFAVNQTCFEQLGTINDLKAEVERLKTKGDADCRYLRGQYDSIVEMLHREQAKVERLQEALNEMVTKWATHSGLCCTFDAAGKVVVTDESCVCDPMHKRARAALRGGGEHFKHPAGDYCVYCRAQWPCEESGGQR